MPPYDEMRNLWRNGNPMTIEQGGNPRELQGPMAYVLGYWALRYYGMLDGTE